MFSPLFTSLFKVEISTDDSILDFFLWSFAQQPFLFLALYLAFVLNFIPINTWKKYLFYLLSLKKADKRKSTYKYQASDWKHLVLFVKCTLLKTQNNQVTLHVNKTEHQVNTSLYRKWRRWDVGRFRIPKNPWKYPIIFLATTSDMALFFFFLQITEVCSQKTIYLVEQW